MKLKRKLKKAWRAMRHSNKAMIGAVMILILLIIATLAPVISLYEYDEMNTGPLLETASREHPMGTDNYGRDVFSRIVMGTRVSLRIGFTVTILAVLIGVPLGLLAGYQENLMGSLIMRTVDVMLCFPWVMVALCIAALIGGGESVVIIALVFAYVPTFVRLMRGVVLSVREQEYVAAAKVTGESKWSIITKYVLPNCLAPLIVEATLVMSFVILDEAAISYLGIGVKSPTPSWGTMLNDGAQFTWSTPSLSIFPGIAIAYTVLAINLFGDGLRDILDPRHMGGLRE